MRLSLFWVLYVVSWNFFYRRFGLPVCPSLRVSVLFSLIIVETERRNTLFASAPKAVPPSPPHCHRCAQAVLLPSKFFISILCEVSIPVHLSISLVLAFVFQLSVNFLLMLQPNWLFYLLWEPIKIFPGFFLDCFTTEDGLNTLSRNVGELQK